MKVISIQNMAVIMLLLDDVQLPFRFPSQYKPSLKLQAPFRNELLTCCNAACGINKVA